MKNKLYSILIGTAVCVVVSLFLWGFIKFVSYMNAKGRFYRHLDEGEIITFNGEQCVYMDQNWAKGNAQWHRWKN